MTWLSTFFLFHTLYIPTLHAWSRAEPEQSTNIGIVDHNNDHGDDHDHDPSDHRDHDQQDGHGRR